jgi:hypothetical protein
MEKAYAQSGEVQQKITGYDPRQPTVVTGGMVMLAESDLLVRSGWLETTSRAC